MLSRGEGRTRSEAEVEGAEEAGERVRGTVAARATRRRFRRWSRATDLAAATKQTGHRRQSPAR